MSARATISPFIGTYSADPDHSSVGFALRDMTVATLRGSFSDVEAWVAVADDGSLSLSGTAQVYSISIDSSPEFRNHVLGADFLDAPRHPVIVFRSDPAPLGEDGSIAVHGWLTIRNVTRAVVAIGTWSAPVEDRYGSMRGAVQLTTTVDRRDYGMPWNALLPKGSDALGTQVTVTVDAILGISSVALCDSYFAARLWTLATKLPCRATSSRKPPARSRRSERAVQRLRRRACWPSGVVGTQIR